MFMLNNTVEYVGIPARPKMAHGFLRDSSHTAFSSQSTSGR